MALITPMALIALIAPTPPMTPANSQLSRYRADGQNADRDLR